MQRFALNGSPLRAAYLLRGFATKAEAPKNILSIQSHVVYGHAGNSAAVFPMRRLGANVWPLNTVQFSNHTQYGKWKGMVVPGEQVTEVVDGIAEIGELGRCDAVLSGYLGSPEQGAFVLEAVAKTKAANPSALFCCDPVMGDPEKGCIVADGVKDFHQHQSVMAADIMCPNILELSIIAGLGEQGISSLDGVVEAARSVIARGPSLKMVFVKNVSKVGGGHEVFEMMLVDADNAWRISTPLVKLNRQPVGVGDLTSGLFLARLVQGAPPVEALEHATAAYYDVLRVTAELDEYELQVVAAQDFIASPSTQFTAVKL